MPLIFLSCAWVLGIWLGSLYALPPILIFCGLLPLPFLFLGKRYRKQLLIISLSLVFLCGGALYTTVAITSDNDAAEFIGQGFIEIKGTIRTPPVVRDNLTHIELTVAEVDAGTGWQKSGGRVLTFVPRYPEYSYGDVLWLKGRLESPPPIEGFDYQAYLASQGILSTLLFPQIKLLERGTGSPPLRWIYDLRKDLSQSLAAALPEPQASLAQGIVLGIRSTIPEGLKTDLSITGSAHLLAISGINLSIITGLLVTLGIWLWGRRYYLYVWLALAMIWLYALLTGLEAPVVRAAIMATLFLIAELLGRQKSTFAALAFSAAIMVGLDPRVLWSVSFQLSFLAMAGLIFISPLFLNRGRMLLLSHLAEEGAGFRFAAFILDSFAVTLAALIAVWPLIAYYFHIFSLVGFLSTLLLSPALPAIIVTGILTAVSGLISPPVAQIFGWTAWMLLSYMLVLVQTLASLSLAYFSIEKLWSGMVWIYYIILVVVIAVKTYNRKMAGCISRSYFFLRSGFLKASIIYTGISQKWIIIPLLVTAFLTSYTAAAFPDSQLHVSTLDVGEGDAILVRVGSQDILIDGGPSPQAVCQRLSEKLPFWDRKIDLVILTHPHLDHISGLVEVLKRYHVEAVLIPNLTSSSPVYLEWLTLLKERNIRCMTAVSSQRISLGGGSVLEVLHAPEGPPDSDDQNMDNQGVVLKLTLNDISFLFMADAGVETETRLIRGRASLRSTVLKAGHHGSANSTTSAFLSSVNPQIAVISVGEDNLHRHPDPAMLERLATVLGPEGLIYRTDRNGTVEFVTDGSRLWIKTAR